MMPGLSRLTKSNTDQEAQVTLGLPASGGLQWFLDLVFPPRCAGCQQVDTYWCDRCQQEIDDIPLDAVVKPHAPLMDVAVSAYHVGKLQQALWALKYENAPAMAKPLGERMANCFSRLNWKVDMIVPVPLHMKRLQERGYNQAQLLGENAAMHLSLPCIPAALGRQRQTQSQVTLNYEQRQENMMDAFYADTELVQSKTILLVDDVYTTGATLAACAEAALKAGAAAVYGLTVTTPAPYSQRQVVGVRDFPV